MEKKSETTIFKPNFNVFYLMRLVGRYYFKNGTVIFTDFILPVIIMSILYNILDEAGVKGLTPGVILSPIVSSSFISFTASLVEWRNSVFMKKIRVSQISTVQFFATFLLFFLFIGLMLFGTSLAYTLLLEAAGIKELQGTTKHLANVNWGYALLGLFQLIIIAIATGFIVSNFVKRVTAAVAVCLSLFLIQSFLIGYYLPIHLIGKKPMQIVSYAMPFYAPTRIFQAAWLQDLEVNGEFGKYLYVENWTVWTTSGEKTDINFNKSYWSMILLGFGWITVITGPVLWFAGRKKA